MGSINVLATSAYTSLNFPFRIVVGGLRRRRDLFDVYGGARASFLFDGLVSGIRNQSEKHSGQGHCCDAQKSRRAAKAPGHEA